MSSKNKSKPAHAPAGPSNTSGRGAAEAALAAAHYKDAIEHFKELRKREPGADWRSGLAAAYAGRAGQLAAKRMFNEALALWRTRAEICSVPLLDGLYVTWLMQSGQMQQALQLLPSVSALPSPAREAAHAQLALAVLVAPDELLAGLSDEDRDHRRAAQAAIAACADGDSPGWESTLQAISYRSPYRALRPLLKALALRASDPAAATAALERVPPNGPFQGLARALRVCLMPGTDWLAGLLELDDAGRALVLDLKACPPAQRALVLELMACSTPPLPTPQRLLETLLRHRRVLPDSLVRRLGVRLLPHAPQLLNTFKAGAPLGDAEEQQVLALAAELKQRPGQAEDHWLQLVMLLRNRQNTQRRAALVLRRLADAHAHHSADGSLCGHAQEWLTQSLELDPSDRDTHLRLLRDARLHGDLKQARQRLETARRWFPTDTPVLQEAVEIALAAGSFKKAAGLAKQVLETDPINPQVRALIGQAHVAHARKLIASLKLPAAQRELDQAQEWMRTGPERGLLDLLRALAAQPPGSADAALPAAFTALGGRLRGAYNLLVEAQRVKSGPAFASQDLLRRAGIDSKATPDAAEVVALAQALHGNARQDAQQRTAMGALHGMLSRAAASTQFTESDQLLICEALHRHAHADLAHRFASAALRRWPGRPVFVFLATASRYGTTPWRIPKGEWQRLELAFDLAREQGDERTAGRLSKLLGGDDEPPGLPHLGDAAGIGSIADLLLKLGGEDRFLELARRELGKTLFDQVRRDVNGSKSQFAQALAEILGAALDSSVLPAPKVPKAPPSPKVPTPASFVQPGLFDD